MKSIWRFFEQNNCISGIVITKSEEEAICYAQKYLANQFNNIKNEDSLDVIVWRIEDDDDYNNKFPYAIAINY